MLEGAPGARVVPVSVSALADQLDASLQARVNHDRSDITTVAGLRQSCKCAWRLMSAEPGCTFTRRSTL